MDRPVFQPPEGLALWLPLPATDAATRLRLACEHSVKIGFLSLTVPEGFATDGASIPRILQFCFPIKVLLLIHRAGIFHDYAYRTQPDGVSRFEADSIFRVIMAADGVRQPWLVLCYFAVRLFGWRPWRQSSVSIDAARKSLDYDAATEGWQK